MLQELVFYLATGFPGSLSEPLQLSSVSVSSISAAIHLLISVLIKCHQTALPRLLLLLQEGVFYMTSHLHFRGMDYLYFILLWDILRHLPVLRDLNLQYFCHTKTFISFLLIKSALTYPQYLSSVQRYSYMFVTLQGSK